MCHYAEKSYKLHYACVPCRVSFKRHPASVLEGHRCPRCSGPVLGAGLRYEGLEPCGCGRKPEFRPRTRARLRARRIAAARTGAPLAEMLRREDPAG
ncbi:hypothetical protein [Streptomyces sp. bgisy091]|uniref:hypothetical protein n=1 Tax=Streptomyces sp. bgisy091 TaxID=3413778 RepID=UPI003D7560E3